MPQTLKDINTVPVIDPPPAGALDLFSQADGHGPFRTPRRAVFGPTEIDTGRYASVQEAVDAAGVVAVATGRGVTVRLSTMFTVSRPVYCDFSNVRLRGDGPGCGLQTTGDFSAVVFGFSRTGGAFVEPTHYTDLYGVADTSLVPTAASVFGYNLSGDSYLALPATPFELGPRRATNTAVPDFYQTTTAFVLDLLVKSNTSTWAADVFLCGLGNRRFGNKPESYYLWYEAGSTRLVFTFITRDGLERHIYVPFAGDTPTLRFMLQIDFTAATVLAAVNGLEVTPDLTEINSGWTASTGLTFAQSWVSEFRLGVGTTPNTPTTAPFLVGGLTLCNAAKYAFHGAGVAPTRIDGLPVNDLNTFAAAHASDFAVLSRPAAPEGNDRLVPWLGRSRGLSSAGYGYFIHAGYGSNDNLTGNGLADLSIILPGCYGIGVTYGACYDFVARAVTFEVGARGFSSIVAPTSYPTLLEQCQFLFQRDCSLLLGTGIHRIVRCTLKFYNRNAMRFSTTGVTIRDTFVTDAAECVNVIRAVSSLLNIDNLSVDFERNDNPTECHIYISAEQNAGGNSHVIRNAQGGGGVPGTPYIKLDASEFGGVDGPSLTGGYLVLENSYNAFVDPGLSAVVAADSQFWRGRYSGQPPGVIPIAVNWLNPGEPARFGLETVPAAASLPAVPGFNLATLSDPLIGQLKASDLALTNGATVVTWTDGTITATSTSSSIKYRSAGLNGLPAVQFDGTGYFTLSGLTGTSGGLTVISVVLGGQPVWDTRPGNVRDLRLFGFLQMVGSSPAVVLPLVPAATTACVVTARLTGAPGRCLELYVNHQRVGHYKLNSDAGVVFGAAPNLGSQNNGETNMVGLLAEQVYLDGPLTDQELRDAIQDVVYRNQVTV